MNKLIAVLLFTLIAFAEDAARIRVGSPVPPWPAGGTFALSTHILDAANDAVDFIFYAEADVTVTHLCVHHASSAGAARQYILALTSVDGSSVPSTVLATAMIDPITSAFGAATVQCAAITHDGAGGALSNYAASQGTVYAIKLQPCQNTTAPCTDATAPDGTNNSTFNHGTSATVINRPNLPYPGTTNAGTRTKQSHWPIYGYRSATASYGNLVSAINVGSQISSGASMGMHWTLPAGHGDTYKVAGVEWSGRVTGAKTIRIALYPGNSTTEISNCAVNYDTDNGQSAGSDNRTAVAFFPSTCGALSYGTAYRVDFSPQDASAGFTINSFTFAAAGDRSAFPGSTWFGSISRSGCTGVCDTEAFTDDDTNRPFINLILSDVTEPSGSSVIGGGFAISQ